jgi:dTDP-4-dehydrorhamnose 3,5-epimerase
MSGKRIKAIKGGLVVDDRGTVSFVNDFNFKKVKRFYAVSNHSKDTVRAFHAHRKESKYAYVSSGSAILCVVRITDFDKPSKRVKVKRFILSEKKPEILYIPPGHANGFKPLINNSKIIFFSTSTLEQSKGDDFRYPYDYWGKEIWKVKYR